MDLLKEDMMNYWYLWILAALFFSSASFCFGFCAVKDKKSTVKRLLPMICIELLIAAVSMLTVNRWIKRGVSLWWVIFEHGPEVYITVITFVSILLGYLTGMAFARRKV